MAESPDAGSQALSLGHLVRSSLITSVHLETWDAPLPVVLSVALLRLYLISHDI
jgi:hypothetical protein